MKDQGSPDWVWIHSSLWAGAALAPLLAELRIPFLIEEHLKEFLFPERLTSFQSRLIQKTYNRTTRVAGPSRAVVAALQSRFVLPDHRGLVLPNPVDSIVFTLSEKPPDPIPVVWVSVGLFRKEKRYDSCWRLLRMLFIPPTVPND
ncbi:MAG: glycosyltransferase family 4 protein [FCB group bacterium]|nr:glycosyltransferase family 4 protein [FCB group bacterium]